MFVYVATNFDWRTDDRLALRIIARRGQAEWGRSSCMHLINPTSVCRICNSDLQNQPKSQFYASSSGVSVSSVMDQLRTGVKIRYRRKYKRAVETFHVRTRSRIRLQKWSNCGLLVGPKNPSVHHFGDPPHQNFVSNAHLFHQVTCPDESLSAPDLPLTFLVH